MNFRATAIPPLLFKGENGLSPVFRERLRLAQNEIDHPTAPDVFTRRTAGVQAVGVVATRTHANT
jgi:hypothetical protein